MADDKIASDNNAKNLHNLRILSFLSTRTAGIILILFFLLMTGTGLQYLFRWLQPNNYRFNAYSMSNVQNAGTWIILSLWAISIILLFIKRQYWYGIGRIVLIPIIFIVAEVSMFFTWPIFYQSATGFPLANVYSKTRDKYFIFAAEPMSIDVSYRMLSSDHTLTNLFWKLELTRIGAHYSEEIASVQPCLVLSEDEELIAVKRGQFLTDVFSIEPMQPIMGWNREQAPANRSARIQAILAQHMRNTLHYEAPLSYPQLRSVLKEYFHGLGNQLNSTIANGSYNISCEFTEVDQNDTQIHVRYDITAREGEKRYHSGRDMRLIDDHGNLIVTTQDEGLSWSDEKEKQVNTIIRDAIIRLAGEGTIINQKQ